MELPPGAVIGGLYEVLGPIGKGGTSLVYAARHAGSGEDVAVKLLSLGENAAEARRRFFREILLVTRVRHPHVVAIRDFGAHEGAPYLVMERLRGTTLHQALRIGGAMPEERVAALFVGALGALAEAHAKGVVHRDVKPSNLFLREHDDGAEDLVLIDWGIAGRLGGPRPEGWTATPRYAAPEYILRGEIRPCLDVYQAGLSIAEALTGRPVVPTTDAASCVAAHVRGPLVLGTEVLRSRLRSVIERALRRDPDERYADGAALLRAFLVALDDDAPTRLLRPLDLPGSEDSFPAAAPERVPSPAPIVAALLAALALAAALFAWLATARALP